MPIRRLTQHRVSVLIRVILKTVFTSVLLTMYTRPMLYKKLIHTNLSLLPAHIDLVGAEIEMINLENREYKMQAVSS